MPYRMLVEEMSEGALTIATDGLILYANRGFAKMLDVPLSKVTGSSLLDWVGERAVRPCSRCSTKRPRRASRSASSN